MRVYMKKICLALAIFVSCLALGIFSANVAYAYTINVSGGYNGIPYSFRVHNSFTTSEGSAMSSAAKAWESAGKGVLAQKSTYTNAMTSYPVKDGYNNITRISTTKDYLAECSWWTSSNKITEADINFSTSYTIVTNPNSSQYDMQTIMTHEIGHALGLGHSDDTSAVMKPTFGGGEKLRTINSDDIDGIKEIY